MRLFRILELHTFTQIKYQGKQTEKEEEEKFFKFIARNCNK